ncbi:MAG: hypothetical protein AB1391_03670 [Candidatus Micrarchaeota archaeon]
MEVKEVKIDETMNLNQRDTLIQDRTTRYIRTQTPLSDKVKNID